MSSPNSLALGRAGRQGLRDFDRGVSFLSDLATGSEAVPQVWPEAYERQVVRLAQIKKPTMISVIWAGWCGRVC